MIEQHNRRHTDPPMWKTAVAALAVCVWFTLGALALWAAMIALMAM